MTSEYERPVPQGMVPAPLTRQTIINTVTKAAEARYDGPGYSWRGWLMAGILRAIAEANVLYPEQQRQVLALSQRMADDAAVNFEDEWPK